MFIIFAGELIVMPRPKRKRWIQEAPAAIGFKPVSGKQMPDNFDVELKLDEYEALRLADYIGLSQQEAAALMQISRPTFTRVYDSARKKMVQVLVENLSMQIAGGSIKMEDDWYRCPDCDDVFTGMNHHCGSDNDTFNSNMEHINSSLNTGEKMSHIINNRTHMGVCECVKCQYSLPKKRGIPCQTFVCPKCGGRMRKENKKTGMS